MTTANQLLERGYFPRELPPCFTTAAFAGFIARSRGSLPAAALTQWTRSVAHNLGRPGGLRRPLKIPNPFSHLLLCEEIERQWALLDTHFKSAKVSASRPRVTKVLGRAVVPRLRIGELPKLRARRWRGARYFLRTDINQFYPSIYTHSIPWALHSKATAKSNLGKLPGDQIDRAARIQQWGQTVGIPIGPDTSLILAEAILTAVDRELLSRCASVLPVFRGFRYVDDYELPFQNLTQAEAVLVELQAILSEFELVLNPRKTSIREMPVALEYAWALELSRFTIRDTPRGQTNDLIALFSRAFELAATNSEEPVLRYAIMRVRSLSVGSPTWRIFESLIYDTVSADPSALPSALGVLSVVSTAGGHKMSKLGLSEVIESIVLRHAPLAHGSEVAWCMWAALSFGIQLSDAVASAVEKMDDDVVALLALDADSRGLFGNRGINPARWAALVGTADALESEHWLLAYEAEVRGWLNTSSIGKHPLFSVSHSASVSFYDPALTAPTFPPAGFSAPGGTLGYD